MIINDNQWYLTKLVCTSIPAMSMIPHKIRWWDISLVQVIQVVLCQWYFMKEVGEISMVKVIQVIQLIQVMQVRLAHLWLDFRVILHTIWNDSDYLVVCAFLRLNRRNYVVKLSFLCFFLLGAKCLGAKLS